MSVQESIRTLDSHGISGREIARRLGVSRDAVAKYADHEDFSPAPATPTARPRGWVLTGFEHLIEQWLVEDQQRNYKQRHTAKRVIDWPVQEHGYTGAYSPAQRFVCRWRAANRQTGEGFTELVWPAGTVPVDFGEAEAIITGIRQVVHILLVT